MSKWVKNFDVLAATPERKAALEILEAGYDAVDTTKAIREQFVFEPSSSTLRIQGQTYRLSEFEKVYVVAIGKCGVKAATELEAILGERITGGLVLDKEIGYFKKLKSLVGTHPFPSEQNVTATGEIVSLLDSATEKDLVIMVISGGGSALFSSPYDIEVTTLARITACIMNAGADIHELNTVRKHISNVAGGHLAKIAHPATVAALIFSDVLGDDLSAIASGPLTKDETTVADAQAILDKYEILSVCGLSELKLQETPKEDEFFKKVSSFLFINNSRALEAMRAKASYLGYNAKVVTNRLSGEAREVGEKFAREALDSKSVLLYGGETTVTVRGTNPGGRNQEVALGALGHIVDDRVLISAASDGYDNTEYAGAVADKLSKEKASALGLNTVEYLAQNNSYNFWKLNGSYLETGPTGSNVSDLVLILRN